MKALVDNIQLEGTVEEISRFIKIHTGKMQIEPEVRGAL